MKKIIVSVALFPWSAFILFAAWVWKMIEPFFHMIGICSGMH